MNRVKISKTVRIVALGNEFMFMYNADWVGLIDADVPIGDLLKLMRRFFGDLCGVRSYVTCKFSMLETRARYPFVGLFLTRENLVKFIDGIDTSIGSVRLYSQGQRNRITSWLSKGYLQMTIDFDKLTITYHNRALGASITWTMKELHRLSDPSDLSAALRSWTRQRYPRRSMKALEQAVFNRNLAAKIIQHWWRQEITHRRAYDPPNGFFFQLAAGRFEKAQMKKT